MGNLISTATPAVFTTQQLDISPNDANTFIISPEFINKNIVTVELQTGTTYRCSSNIDIDINDTIITLFADGTFENNIVSGVDHTVARSNTILNPCKGNTSRELTLLDFKNAYNNFNSVIEGGTYAGNTFLRIRDKAFMTLGTNSNRLQVINRDGSLGYVIQLPAYTYCWDGFLVTNDLVYCFATNNKIVIFNVNILYYNIDITGNYVEYNADLTASGIANFKQYNFCVFETPNRIYFIQDTGMYYSDKNTPNIFSSVYLTFPEVYAKVLFTFSDSILYLAEKFGNDNEDNRVYELEITGDNISITKTSSIFSAIYCNVIGTSYTEYAKPFLLKDYLVFPAYSANDKFIRLSDFAVYDYNGNTSEGTFDIYIYSNTHEKYFGFFETGFIYATKYSTVGYTKVRSGLNNPNYVTTTDVTLQNPPSKEVIGVSDVVNVSAEVGVIAVGSGASASYKSLTEDPSKESFDVNTSIVKKTFEGDLTGLAFTLADRMSQRVTVNNVGLELHKSTLVCRKV